MIQLLQQKKNFFYFILPQYVCSCMQTCVYVHASIVWKEYLFHDTRLNKSGTSYPVKGSPAHRQN